MNKPSSFARLLHFFSWAEVKRVLLRFPLSILSSLLCAGIWIHFDFLQGPNSDFAWNYVFEIETLRIVSFVGILTFTALALFAEALQLKGWKNLAVQALGIPLLYGLIVHVAMANHVEANSSSDSWGSDPMNNFPVFCATALTFFASLFFIFVAPFFRVKGRRLPNDFWNWAMNVALRTGEGIATGLLLLWGLEAAVFATTSLFDLDIPYQLTSAIIPSLTGIVVANWVFVSRLPKNPLDTPNPVHLPSLLFFSKVIALPILLVFEVILLVYLGRIAVTGVWPSGAVAFPVLLYSLLGYLTLFLLYPLRKEHAGVRLVSRFFPYAVLLFMVVYFLGLGQRIQAYGLTEIRYLGVLIGGIVTVWSLIWAAVEWRKSSVRLEVLPAILGIVAVLVSSGPLGLVTVALNSQMDRVEAMFQTVGLLDEAGHLRVLPEGSHPDNQAVLDLDSELSDLYWNYRSPILSQALEQRFGKGFEDSQEPSAFLKSLGLDMVDYIEGSADSQRYVLFTRDEAASVPAANWVFDLNHPCGGAVCYLNNLEGAPRADEAVSLNFPNKQIAELSFDFKTRELVLNVESRTLRFPVQDLITKAQGTEGKGSFSPEELKVEAHSGSVSGWIYFDQFNFDLIREADKTDVTSFDPAALVSIEISGKLYLRD